MKEVSKQAIVFFFKKGTSRKKKHVNYVIESCFLFPTFNILEILSAYKNAKLGNRSVLSKEK